MRRVILGLVVINSAIYASCRPVNMKEPVGSALTESQNAVNIESAIPADRLAKLKAALPKVESPKLQAMLESPQAYWYDHESMEPAYQETGGSSTPTLGVGANKTWTRLLASGEPQRIGKFFFDESKKRFRFPFGVTAGTDDVTNAKVFNFLWLPSKDGKVLPVVKYNRPRNFPPHVGIASRSWGWMYPNGATLAELIFITTPSGQMLPVEIRTRTRYQKGWSVNVYRPFPTAASLSEAIKQRRSDWRSNAQLTTLVNHLDTDQQLTPKTLSAPQLPNTFEQAGALDVLPDFGDEGLVRDLLTQTPFASSYGTAWRSSGDKTTFAPSTKSQYSIVPANYEAGIIAVNEESCMRCHKDAGKPLPMFRSDFGGILLYGEMWGRDGIFSWHPFDSSTFSQLDAIPDNRRVNQKLASQGIVVDENKSIHKAPEYPDQEIHVLNNNTGVASSSPTPNPGPGSASTSNVVEFRIPSGTGRGDWNSQSSPVVVKAGQTVRIINDDSTGHILHSNDDDVCQHGDVSRPVRQGQSFECKVSSRAQKKTYLFWDHQFGGPSSSRFYIRVE